MRKLLLVICLLLIFSSEAIAWCSYAVVHTDTMTGKETNYALSSVDTKEGVKGVKIDTRNAKCSVVLGESDKRNQSGKFSAKEVLTMCIYHEGGNMFATKAIGMDFESGRHIENSHTSALRLFNKQHKDTDLIVVTVNCNK